MSAPSNAGERIPGINGYTKRSVSFEDEMTAFDRLPEKIRQLLRNAPVSPSATGCMEAVCLLDERCAVALVEQSFAEVWDALGQDPMPGMGIGP